MRACKYSLVPDFRHFLGPGIMNTRSHRLAALLAAVAALILSTDATARSKSDVIHLVNGDRITGEIIELKFGELTLKTDSLGTVEIEWPDVARIVRRAHRNGRDPIARL